MSGAFSKGRIRGDRTPEQTALDSVLSDTGVNGEILNMAGTTSYEFFRLDVSVLYEITSFGIRCYPIQMRQTPRISMALCELVFDFKEAIKQVTYSQDKSILMMAWQQFTE